MATIEGIRKQITATIKKNGDTTSLELQLKQQLQAEHADAAIMSEMSRLKAVAEKQKGHEAAAQAILTKVESQSAGVTRFLKGRDSFLKDLDKVISAAEALQTLQDAACGQYAWQSSFKDEACKVPEGYLPADLTCSFLVEPSGVHGAEIAQYLLKFLKQSRSFIAGAYSVEEGLPRLVKEADDLE